jgi:putative ABC transport system permease protein
MMRRITWRRLLHDRRRLALTMTAVAIGVTFLTAALVLSGSTARAFEDSYRQVYAGADVIVRAPEPVGEMPLGDAGTRLDEDVLDEVVAAPGVEAAEPRRRSVAQLTTADGTTHGAIAMAAPDDVAGAAIEVRSGRLPVAPEEVAVDAALAASGGLVVGDTVEVLVPGGSTSAKIVGTVSFGRLDGLAGGGRLLFGGATAAERFGPGFAEIAVRAEPGTDPEALAATLADRLGVDVRVVTAAAAAAADAAAAAGQTAALRWFVSGVAAVALLVGGFVIANTFRVLVSQRTRELALLRAVGATRRQLAGSVRLEAAITGGLGAIVGMLAGLAVGVVLVGTSAGLLPGLPPTSATITWETLVVGPVVGVALALLAGHGAVRRALAVAPVEALRSAAVDDARPGRLRLAAGILLGLLGGLGLLAGMRLGAAAVLAAGVVAAMVGIGLLFPFVTGPVLSLVSRPVGRAGITGELARMQALTAPRRTGATAAALVVTLGLVAFLMVFNASFATTLPGTLAERQHAELVVRSTAPPGLQDDLVRVAAQLDALPEVAVARVITYADLRIDDGAAPQPQTGSVHVVDPATVGRLLDVTATDGRLEELADDQVAVRASFAEGNGWAPGDRLSVELPDATERELEVAALFEGQIATNLLLAPGAVDGHLPAAYRDVLVDVADGAEVAEAQARLAPMVASLGTAELLSRDQLAAEMVEANDSTLGILTALFALSLVIGGLGVVNTLTLVVHERIREIGLLRAIGATRRQIRAMIRWEAVLTTALGALLGTLFGLGGAWIAVEALPGPAPAIVVPSAHLAGAILATMLLGVVAAVLPAAKAARIDLIQTLQAS